MKDKKSIRLILASVLIVIGLFLGNRFFEGPADVGAAARIRYGCVSTEQIYTAGQYEERLNVTCRGRAGNLTLSS